MSIQELLSQKLEEIDPAKYAKTRNYVSDGVTELGPFISRGVIDTRWVWEHLLKKGYDFDVMYGFVQQLAWRDFFQRVWQQRGEGINLDIRRNQEGVEHELIPSAIANGATGIEGIDRGIGSLLNSGLMHNHIRMYTAFLSCNLGKSHWHLSAQWMYSHLLDGDWGSNALSWQWVAGTFSNKKYIANQENINRFTDTNQNGTYLDKPYEELLESKIPNQLMELTGMEDVLPYSECDEDAMLSTAKEHGLKTLTKIDLDGLDSVSLFNYYQLSFQWQSGISSLPILLLEPSVFKRYPISKKCLDFMCSVAKEIPGMRVFVGEFCALEKVLDGCEVHFREHPLNLHYQGQIHQRNWLAPEVEGEFSSFFSYWKKVEKSLRRESKEYRGN